VVPGTGGSPCSQVDTCYGPDEWVINLRGGLAGYDNYLQNEVWSPPIAIPELDFDRMNLVFTEYLHNGIDWPTNLVYTVWHVRSTADPTGATGWSEWRDRDELGFGNKIYRQRLEILTDLLVPDCRKVQLAVGIEERPPSVWENWGTPAPYFDDVSLYLVSGLSDTPELAAELRLEQPVPNPFNPSTTIAFTLPTAGQAILGVYDLRGQLVRCLVDEVRSAGTHHVEWDGTDAGGASVAAGTYIFRMQSNGDELATKGSLLK